MSSLLIFCFAYMFKGQLHMRFSLPSNDMQKGYSNTLKASLHVNVSKQQFFIGEYQWIIPANHKWITIFMCSNTLISGMEIAGAKVQICARKAVHCTWVCHKTVYKKHRPRAASCKIKSKLRTRWPIWGKGDSDMITKLPSPLITLLSPRKALIDNTFFFNSQTVHQIKFYSFELQLSESNMITSFFQ